VVLCLQEVGYDIFPLKKESLVLSNSHSCGQTLYLPTVSYFVLTRKSCFKRDDVSLHYRSYERNFLSLYFPRRKSVVDGSGVQLDHPT